MMKSYCFAVAVALAAAVSLPLGASASLVQNPDFELDNGGDPLFPDSWFRGGSIGYELADDSDGVGSRSAEITGTGSDYRSSAFFVTPGEPLVWSLDYKFLDGSSGQFSADLRFFAGFDPVGGGTAGAFRGEQRIVVTADATGVWQTLGPNSLEVPAGALTADVRISNGFFDDGLVGQGFRIDNVDVRIPEPASLGLAGVAVAAASLRRRGRR
ncbi:PEP-CTERM sorting domain-containing protein [Botrimarina sp.]|uniref:PEP-CTERM sorting domain-containing protein n=1 Tax=Botrimarina sp. TaxID=2795802 RepID=UPI0032EADBE7